MEGGQPKGNLVRDTQFGSMNSRHLTLRWRVPFSMTRWHDHEWRFHWPKLLNPMNWWRAVCDKWSWQAEFRRYVGANQRCYCDTGSMIDGRLVICGFGVIWFYSHYTGEVPCWCDKSMAEEFGDD